MSTRAAAIGALVLLIAGFVLVSFIPDSWRFSIISPSGIGPALFIRSEIEVIIRPVVQVIVSFAVGGTALAVILFRRFAEADKEWAYGAIGIIVGFWLPT